MVVVIVGRQRPPWRPRAAPEDREVNHKGWGVGRQRRAEDPMAADGHRVAAESCSARHFQKLAFFFSNKRIFEFNLQLQLSLKFLPIHTSFVATGGATIGILVIHTCDCIVGYCRRYWFPSRKKRSWRNWVTPRSVCIPVV